MSIFYRKYQNQSKNTTAYGKWYGRAVTLGKTPSATSATPSQRKKHPRKFAHVADFP